MQVILPHTMSDIDTRDAAGNSPLIHAITESSLPVVQLLIQSDADITLAGNHGMSALHVASLKGQPEIFRYLLESQQSDIKQPRAAANIWLHASRGGNPEVLQILYDSDLSLADIEKDTVVAMMIEIALDGDDEALATLLGYISSEVKFSQGFTDRLLILASKNGCLESVQLLLSVSRFPESSFQGWTALHAAAKEGHRDVVEALIEVGAGVGVIDPRSGKTPRELAIEKGHESIVQILALNASNPRLPKALLSSAKDATALRRRKLRRPIRNCACGDLRSLPD